MPVATALMAIDAGTTSSWRHASVASIASAHHSAPHSAGGPASAARKSSHGKAIHGGRGVDSLRSDDAGSDHPLRDERGAIFRHVADVLTIVTFGPVGGVSAIAGNVACSVARVTEQFRGAVLGHVTQFGALEAFDLWRRATERRAGSSSHIPRVRRRSRHVADFGATVVGAHSHHRRHASVAVSRGHAHACGTAAGPIHVVTHGAGSLAVARLARPSVTRLTRSTVTGVSILENGHFDFCLGKTFTIKVSYVAQSARF